MAGSGSAMLTMSLSWGAGMSCSQTYNFNLTNARIEYTEGNVTETGYSPTSARGTNHLGAPSKYRPLSAVSQPGSLLCFIEFCLGFFCVFSLQSIDFYSHLIN